MRDAMELSEAAEEMLAALWLAREEGAKGSSSLSALLPSKEEAIGELSHSGLLRIRGEEVSLTSAGEKQAASVIRRERLAERLLADVLNVGDALAAEAACKFEHILRAGIDDEICTLLGHPKVCPHGSPIPAGPCCQEGAVAAGKVVSSLEDLSPGQTGVIAYLHSRRRELVERLLALGAIPGTPVRLLQKAPSYVVQLGNAQIALDRETAADIYVRLSGSPASARPPRRRLRLRLGRALRGR